MASGQVYTNNPNNLADYYTQLKNLKATDVMRVFDKYIYNQPAVILSVYPKGNPTAVARPNNFEMDTTKVYEKALKAEKSNLQYAKAKDDFDRSKQPIPGPINSLKVPEYWAKTLDNNLKMIGTFSEELPLVSIQLAVGAGHVFEPIEKAGIATLTAEMFKESTVNNAGEVLSQALSNMGSRIDVNANSTEIVFNINSLLKNLDSTLAIFKEIFFTPIMDQDEFAKVKNQLLQNISNQNMQATAIASNSYNKYLLSTPLNIYIESFMMLSANRLELIYLKIGKVFSINYKKVARKSQRFNPDSLVIVWCKTSC